MLPEQPAAAGRQGAPPVAPPVAAIMVARDPGSWFEASVTSVVTQDYPHLEVLVLDVGGRGSDLPARLAAVAPNAFYHALDGRDPGLGPAWDRAAALVEGAAFLLFLHDDVELEPGAIAGLVEAAWRLNAGIVGPKLVSADDPERLCALGGDVDALGVVGGGVERGELDQGQHDDTTFVDVVSSSAMLVRADLFRALGGFDTQMPWSGEDVDLCLRAKAAGARVAVAPGVRVRHREAWRSGDRPLVPGPDRPWAAQVVGDPRRLERRHELLSSLTVCPGSKVAPILALALGTSVAELAIPGEGVRRAAAGLSAIGWVLTHPGRLRRRRARVRALSSDESRLRARLRSYRLDDVARHPGRLETEPAPASGSGWGPEPGDGGTGDEWAEPDAPALRRSERGGGRWRRAAGVLALVLVVVGVRNLLFGALPHLGAMLGGSGGLGLLGAFASGGRLDGVGGSSPAVPAFGLLGLGSLPLGGDVPLLERLVLVGSLALGALGSVFALRPLVGRAGRTAGVLALLGAPIVWSALSGLAWPEVFEIALLPFVLGLAIRAATRGDQSREGASAPTWPVGVLGRAVAGGLVVALASAFEPGMLVAVALGVVGIALSAPFVGRFRESLRALGVLGGSLVVAVALLAPWSLEELVHAGSLAGLVGEGAPAAQAPTLWHVVTASLGGLGSPLLAGAVVVLAALGLVTTTGARWRWAARAWAIALSSWAVAWLGALGRLGTTPATPLPMAAVGAVAMAVAAGLCVGELTAKASPARRWRRAGLALSAVLLVVAWVEIVPWAGSGRVRAPLAGFSSVLEGATGTPRGGEALWIGQSGALPGQHWALGRSLAFSVLPVGGEGTLRTDFGLDAPGPASTLANDVLGAEHGRTDQLGALLATEGVSEIVVPNAIAPTSGGGRAGSMPVGRVLTSALLRQSDLRQVPNDPAVLVLDNTAWRAGQGPFPLSSTPTLPSEVDVAWEVAAWAAALVVLSVSRRRERSAGGARLVTPPAPPRGADGSERDAALAARAGS
jgi:GT2 family glycosyltransferase